MKIGIFGTGYVGLVTGVCFAEMGNDVTCVDINHERIQKLNDGQSPIYELGLAQLIQKNLQARRVHFTTNPVAGIEGKNIIFIAVGTPQKDDGAADLSFVESVAYTIADHLQKPCPIVTKSTVPVGTSARYEQLINERLKARGMDFTIEVVSNPEFLREGSAVKDCLEPARIIVGCKSAETQKIMRHIYEPFLKGGAQIIFMDPPSSEMTKYTANAMLALRISFMNEISRLCEKSGASIEHIRDGVGSDPRIGPHFLNAGLGYGGSCFPKDVRALLYVAENLGVPADLLRATEQSNQIQRESFFDKISQAYDHKLSGKTFAIWGLAFKPNTDDIREAPALYLIQRFLAAGAKVQVYDPEATANAQKQIKDTNIIFTDDAYKALEQAEALIVATEWPHFRDPDFARIKQSLKKPLIFDGRNIYSPSEMQELGFNYISVGRPAISL